jgi:hypothetical protein
MEFITERSDEISAASRAASTSPEVLAAVGGRAYAAGFFLTSSHVVRHVYVIFRGTENIDPFKYAVPLW